MRDIVRELCKVARDLKVSKSFVAEEDSELGNVLQWTTMNGKAYSPAGTTVKNLPPGMYECKSSQQIGYYLDYIPVKTEEILRLPDTVSTRVVAEIQKFWEKEEDFAKIEIPYKRGIIMYGPPGTGKSCTLQLVLADVVKRGGIAMIMDNPETFLECLRIVRAIQPDTPIVVIMEDVDALLDMYSETSILNILDGVEAVDKIVFLATTNYPEKLGDRIMNRPSRFDRRFEVPPLNAPSRKVYLNHLLKKYNPDVNMDIDEWVKDTEGMSISHLKELFVGTVILDDSYDEVLGMLKRMQTEMPDSGGNLFYKSPYGEAHMEGELDLPYADGAIKELVDTKYASLKHASSMIM